jgi:hypothetical protein
MFLFVVLVFVMRQTIQEISEEKHLWLISLTERFGHEFPSFVVVVVVVDVVVVVVVVVVVAVVVIVVVVVVFMRQTIQEILEIKTPINDITN